jgi:hypothetical protein
MKRKLLYVLLTLMCLINKKVIAQFPLPGIAQFQTSNIKVSSADYQFAANSGGSAATIIVQYNTVNSDAALNSGPFQNNGTIPYNLYSTLLRTGTFTGLQPNTTYYWRVKSTNNSGTSTSLVYSFKTLPITPYSSGENFTDITNTSVTFNYTLSAGTATTTSIIEYKTSAAASYTDQVAGCAALGNTIIACSKTISGLLPNTNYLFRVVATNSNGTLTTLGFGTTTLPNPVLPVQTAISASNLTPTTATINYTVNAGNASTTNIVKYGLSATSLTSQVAGTTATGATNTALTSSLPSLVANTVYFYVIESTNSVGTTTSAVQSFTTPQVPILNNLVAYFGFQNDANSNDLAHNLTNATSNNVTYGIGKYGQAAYFTGNEVLSNTTIDPVINNTDFSVCFWEYKETTPILYPTAYELFGSNYVRTNNTVIGVKEVGMFYNATSSRSQFTNTVPTDNAWNHYAFVTTTTGGFKKYNLYINGVQATDQVGALNDLLYHFNNKFTVGGGTNTNGTINATKNFKGRIDELYIYNRALSLAEITLVKDNVTGVLPITLSYFTTKLNNNIVTLNWQTSQEINASHFEVEYSVDGKDFEKVTTVAASGNSGIAQKYTTYHNVALKAKHYYRLKMIDKDGKYTYSQVVVINANNTQALSVILQGTQVQNQLQFTVTSNKATTINIAVTNSIGQTILLPNKKSISAGSNSFSYIINNLSSGVYFLEMVDDSGAKQVVKFLK